MCTVLVIFLNTLVMSSTVLSVVETLTAEINTNYGNSGLVELANISTIGDSEDQLQIPDPILLSVVNIAEEPSLKNKEYYKNDWNTGSFEIRKLKRPTKFLNIHLLFSSYQKSTSTNENGYADGLYKLDYILNFFQDRGSFLTSSTDYKCIMDLVSLQIDELSKMWSYMGGRYLPSLLYMCRVIPVESTPPVDSDKSIQIITTQTDYE